MQALGGSGGLFSIDAQVQLLTEKEMNDFRFIAGGLFFQPSMVLALEGLVKKRRLEKEKRLAADG